MRRDEVVNEIADGPAMEPSALDAIATLVHEHLTPAFKARTPLPALRARIRDILHAKRDSFEAAQLGLITDEECGNLLLAHTDTWVLHHAGEPHDSALGPTLGEVDPAALTRLILAAIGLGEAR